MYWRIRLNIDYEKLRDDLINYFGSALSYTTIAVMYIIKIENASYDELIQTAEQNGFDLNDYKIKTFKL